MQYTVYTNYSHLNLFVKLSRKLKYFRLYNYATIPISIPLTCTTLQRHEKLSDTTYISFSYIKYGLRAGTKAIRYSVNRALYNEKSERNEILF